MTSNSHGKYEETITYSVRKQKRTGKTLFLHSDPPQEKIRKEMNGSRRTITIGRKRVEADSLQARDTRSRST